MTTDIEPRLVDGPAADQVADRYEIQALAAIEDIQDPDEADRLLRIVTAIADVVRLQKLGEDRERRWGAVKLRAERKYAELLPPVKPGPPEGSRNNPKGTSGPNGDGNDISSKPERDARDKARKVAAVDKDRFEDYVNTDPKPSRAGLLRTDTRAKVKRALLALAAEGGEFSGRDAARRAGVKHGEAFVSAWDALYEAGEVPVARPRHEGPPPDGRVRNPDGKTNATRARELRRRRGTGDGYLELLAVQTRISELCAALESVRVQDYGLDEVSLWRLDDVLDDLLSLRPWLDRTLSAVQGRLGDADVRRKIAKLRDPAGRTAEEADTAARLADRLEQKLSMRLTEARPPA